MKYETNEDRRHYLTIWEYGERNCEKNLVLFSLNSSEVLAICITRAKAELFIHKLNKGGKFLKKLWCCVGGEYNKIIWFYQLG